MIAVKDMAGLLKPNGAAPLIAALRAGTSLPIHFHTHATSSASLATALRMVDAGCDIIDVATACEGRRHSKSCPPKDLAERRKFSPMTLHIVALSVRV